MQKQKVVVVGWGGDRCSEPNCTNVACAIVHKDTDEFTSWEICRKCLDKYEVVRDRIAEAFEKAFAGRGD